MPYYYSQDTLEMLENLEKKSTKLKARAIQAFGKNHRIVTILTNNLETIQSIRKILAGIKNNGLDNLVNKGKILALMASIYLNYSKNIGNIEKEREETLNPQDSGNAQAFLSIQYDLMSLTKASIDTLSHILKPPVLISKQEADGIAQEISDQKKEIGGLTPPKGLPLSLKEEKLLVYARNEAETNAKKNGTTLLEELKLLAQNYAQPHETKKSGSKRYSSKFEELFDYQPMHDHAIPFIVDGIAKIFKNPQISSLKNPEEMQQSLIQQSEYLEARLERIIIKYCAEHDYLIGLSYKIEVIRSTIASALDLQALEELLPAFRGQQQKLKTEISKSSDLLQKKGFGKTLAELNSLIHQIEEKLELEKVAPIDAKRSSTPPLSDSTISFSPSPSSYDAITRTESTASDTSNNSTNSGTTSDSGLAAPASSTTPSSSDENASFVSNINSTPTPPSSPASENKKEPTSRRSSTSTSILTLVPIVGVENTEQLGDESKSVEKPINTSPTADLAPPEALTAAAAEQPATKGDDSNTPTSPSPASENKRESISRRGSTSTSILTLAPAEQLDDESKSVEKPVNTSSTVDLAPPEVLTTAAEQPATEGDNSSTPTPPSPASKNEEKEPVSRSARSISISDSQQPTAAKSIDQKPLSAEEGELIALHQEIIAINKKIADLNSLQENAKPDDPQLHQKATEIDSNLGQKIQTILSSSNKIFFKSFRKTREIKKIIDNTIENYRQQHNEKTKEIINYFEGIKKKMEGLTEKLKTIILKDSSEMKLEGLGAYLDNLQQSEKGLAKESWIHQISPNYFSIARSYLSTGTIKDDYQTMITHLQKKLEGKSAEITEEIETINNKFLLGNIHALEKRLNELTRLANRLQQKEIYLLNIKNIQTGSLKNARNSLKNAPNSVNHIEGLFAAIKTEIDKIEFNIADQQRYEKFCLDLAEINNRLTVCKEKNESKHHNKASLEKLIGEAKLLCENGPDANSSNQQLQSYKSQLKAIKGQLNSETQRAKKYLTQITSIDGDYKCHVMSQKELFDNAKIKLETQRSLEKTAKFVNESEKEATLAYKKTAASLNEITERIAQVEHQIKSSGETKLQEIKNIITEREFKVNYLFSFWKGHQVAKEDGTKNQVARTAYKIYEDITAYETNKKPKNAAEYKALFEKIYDKIDKNKKQNETESKSYFFKFWTRSQTTANRYQDILNIIKGESPASQIDHKP